MYMPFQDDRMLFLMQGNVFFMQKRYNRKCFAINGKALQHGTNFIFPFIFSQRTFVVLCTSQCLSIHEYFMHHTTPVLDKYNFLV